MLEMDFSPDEQDRYALRPGDVLVTEGCGSPTELGASAVWGGEIPGFVGFQNHVLRLRSINGLSDARFLTAVARWCHRYGRWLEVASGTSILNIGLNRARTVRVPAPDVATQARIGGLLDSLAELISSNRRRIELLERAVRTTYRGWFIDFHGFGGASLVETDLGAIPRGWDWISLGDAATWHSGGTPRTTEPSFWDGDIPWITSGTLTSMLLDRSERMVTPAGLANGTRLVPRDTLLFVVRGMSLVKEFRVGIADVPLAFGQDCKALVARDGVSPLYLALSVITRAEEIQGMVELAGHGTGKLSTDRLKSVHIPLPPRTLQDRFVDAVTPLRETMTALRLAADRMSNVHDLLLPKLVTGEIDVSHIDLDAIEDEVA